jgi:hypothetical protein
MVTVRLPVTPGQPLLVTLMLLVPEVDHWIVIELVVLGVALPSCDQFQPFAFGVHEPMAVAVKPIGVLGAPLVGPEIEMLEPPPPPGQSCGQVKDSVKPAQIPSPHGGGGGGVGVTVGGGAPWIVIALCVKTLLVSAPPLRFTRNCGV